MKVLILIGTRPNFIKVTRFKDVALKLFPDVKISIVHTGQHYDEKMADIFFSQFKLEPDHYLKIKPASPNKQIAEIMIKLEELCEITGKPDLLIVPGDVNSTLAGALFANKAGIRLAHLEAGLRSFDRTMPEEFNRIVTDELSDIYFVTESSGTNHLEAEGKPIEKIHFVGNTMIDTMVAYENEIDASDVLKEYNLQSEKFVLMTMHRPATVDNKIEFEKLLHLIDSLSDRYKIIFPVHPRTLKNAENFGLHGRISANKSLICTEPLDYFAFQKLIKSCAFIITDSGGIQEESTYRKKPCLTLRPNTERPVTVDTGSNTLLPFDMTLILNTISQIEKGNYKKGNIPELWDGHATERIMKIIAAG
ncbi:MAG: UDP-N-acetylglucosamine 2-epimerase [Bacteroidetes bacterium]|jgi:UDP-N-acetylglucosamine 2-epimerase (non-hydrolysing)|nr:UDP-N-acetylglucosamine 2-epimerase [Bacteroidota bacterium]